MVTVQKVNVAVSTVTVVLVISIVVLDVKVNLANVLLVLLRFQPTTNVVQKMVNAQVISATVNMAIVVLVKTIAISVVKYRKNTLK